MPPSDALRTLEQQKAELLSGVAEWSQDELAYRPALAGWMSVPQVLRFFWVHSHHHGFQLARLRAAARER